MAGGAVMDNHAGVRRHGQRLGVAAMRAGEGGLKFHEFPKSY